MCPSNCCPGVVDGIGERAFRSCPHCIALLTGWVYVIGRAGREVQTLLSETIFTGSTESASVRIGRKVGDLLGVAGLRVE
jgi:hypothetical protein